MIALRRDEQHWLLNDQDARVYGQALQNALRHIPVRRAQKTLDFAMLIIAAGQFEIPRVYMSAQLAKARRQPRPAAPPVFQFRQPPPPPPPAGHNPPHQPPAGGVNGAAAAKPPEMPFEPELDEPGFGP